MRFTAKLRPNQDIGCHSAGVQMSTCFMWTHVKLYDKVNFKGRLNFTDKCVICGETKHMMFETPGKPGYKHLALIFITNAPKTMNRK